tara:strand:- start:26455 stop:26751 length:297 start_codon:yes stop_codon:yes gene_type:complete
MKKHTFAMVASGLLLASSVSFAQAPTDPGPSGVDATGNTAAATPPVGSPPVDGATGGVGGAGIALGVAVVGLAAVAASDSSDGSDDAASGTTGTTGTN